MVEMISGLLNGENQAAIGERFDWWLWAGPWREKKISSDKMAQRAIVDSIHSEARIISLSRTRNTNWVNLG